VSGHRFLLRRMEHALLRRDVRMIDEPMRAKSRSLSAGGALAAIAVVGCAILAYVHPQEALGNAPIVVVKESGALYVRIGDTLHPALNLASARLIVGSPATPETVKQSELRKAKRGVLLGIPGAPDVLSEPVPAGESQWTVCDHATGTTVVGGSRHVDSAATPLTGSRAVLVRPRGESVTYLVHAGARARVSLAEPAVSRALHLDAVEPQELSSALLNTIPEVPPITAPNIPGAGIRGPQTLGMPVGTVIRVAGAEADELFVILTNGVQRIGPGAADIIRFSNSQGTRDIVGVTADAVSAMPSVTPLPVTAFPNDAVRPLHQAVVCAQWSPTAAATGGGVTTFGAPALPFDPAQAAVRLAQADGVGPNVDGVFVPPGRYLFVESTQWYLVSDTGVRYRIDAESAAALGLPRPPVAAPWSFVKLLADGPELTRAGALVAHDGIATVGG
jgi:type VII secretion protein EccB